jgi:phosphoglycerate dehydrogenase-like enzyme
MNKKKALYVLESHNLDKIYGPELQARIAELVDIVAPPQTAESIQADPSVLKDVEIILSGWGMAEIDEAFVRAAPRLKAIFYGAGSVKDFARQALDAGYLVTSAYAANAVPVAEYCVANLILALKRFLPHTRLARAEGRSIWREPLTGAFGSTVGLVSLGMVGRHVLHLLRSYEVKIAAHCITLTDEGARELGVRRCTLQEVCEMSDAISIHTALKPETRGLITGAHIASMKQGATLINASRGAVIRENEMIEVLRRRPDLTAVLDVTDPEPPPPGSPLYTLDNVFLTPHIAGSLHGECRRMGQYVLQELRNYLDGKPPVYGVTREMLDTMA